MTVDVTKSQAYLTLPTINSTDVQWMKWADLVEKKYGPNLGKQVFIAKWNKSGSQAANTIAFRKHIKKEYGIEIDESIFNKVADLGGGIADGFGKIFKVGRITLLIVGGVAVVAVIGTIISAVKKGTAPLKAIRG